MGLCSGVKHQHNPPEGSVLFTAGLDLCAYAWENLTGVMGGLGQVGPPMGSPPWTQGTTEHSQPLPWHLTLLARYGYMGASNTPRHSPMEPSLVETLMTAALLQLSPSFPMPFAALSRSGRNS